MAAGFATVRIREVYRGMTMVVDVRGLRVSQIRFAIAKPFFHLAAWIAGLGGVGFEGEEG